MFSILAKDVSIGDMVTVGDGKQIGFSLVKNIRLESKMGAYVPLTEAGTLLVDGVLVSSYTNMDHRLAHILSQPLRWFPTWFLDNQESQDVEGIRTVPWIAREILNIMGFANMKEKNKETVQMLSQMTMDNTNKME